MWITRPERSFGSNHVVLGGIMLPVVRNIHKLLHGYGVESKCHSHFPGIHTVLEFAETADSANEVDTLVGTQVGDAEYVAEYQVA